jgi:hypothetical protein
MKRAYALLMIMLGTTYGVALAQRPDSAAIRIVRDCGRWRWDVKILADPDTAIIDFRNIKKVTVPDLTELRPLITSEFMPRQYAERNVYDVTAELYGFAINNYRDWELYLRDTATGATMIAAIPDPDCPEIARTPRAQLYRDIRTWLRDSLADTTGKLADTVPVRLVGIGFYDRLQNQAGMAENGITLHPVLALQRDIPPPPAPIAGTPFVQTGTTTAPVAIRRTSARKVSKARKRKTYRKRRVKRRKSRLRKKKWYRYRYKKRVRAAKKLSEVGGSTMGWIAAEQIALVDVLAIRGATPYRL